MNERVRPKEGRPKTLLALGKVVKPWGVRGAVKVHSYAESVESFLRISELRIQDDEGAAALCVEEARQHKKAILLKFRGRDRVEDVEDLVGRTLYADQAELPRLEEGEYYWRELIGMEVCTDRGKPVGRLEKILDTAGHDVYVVRLGERETLIPAVRDVIREVDVDEKRMIIHAVEGLLNEDDL